MKKEIIQENKARWEVFEWMGSTQTKIIWAVAAAIVVLGIVYLSVRTDSPPAGATAIVALMLRSAHALA